jgi:hypothetical protein
VEAIETNLDQIENIHRFTLPTLKTDQQYKTLVQMIRLKYDDSLADNENIVTMYLNEDNEFNRFNSDDGMKIAVQSQMAISNESDPNSIGFVFKVYTGRTVDQSSDENMHGYFVFFL